MFYSVNNAMLYSKADRGSHWKDRGSPLSNVILGYSSIVHRFNT